jgi:nucleoside-diphosphate-sugar epimerase
LKSLAEAHQSGWTWARIFYPYGTGEHCGRTATSFLRSLKARQPLVLKTGASQKDFIEITDLASALAHLSRGLPQGVINLGTGIPTSIRDLALSAARLTGASPGLVQDAEPPGADPYAYHVACTAKLSATGWRPSVGLTEGMSRLLASLHDS